VNIESWLGGVTLFWAAAFLALWWRAGPPGTHDMQGFLSLWMLSCIVVFFIAIIVG